MKRIIAMAVVLLLASLAQTRAVVLVRELWDNVTNGPVVSSGNTPNEYLQGQGNGTTSYGFFGPTFTWTVNPADPAATNALLINPNTDLGAYYYAYNVLYPTLPVSWTTPGTLSLADNTNGWNSGTWATRFLSLNSWIHLNSDSTNYFSFFWVKRSFYYPVNGTNGYGADDAGLGVGFSAGNSASSAFLGMGITRSVAANTYTGTGYWITNAQYPSGVDIGDTPYITAGTLGQAGYPGHPGDSGGPYYVRAYAGDGSGAGGVINQCEGYIGGFPTMSGNTYMWGGLLVGRIITSTSGVTLVSIKNYSGWDTDPAHYTLDTTPPTTWDDNYSFTNSSTLDYLLVWMYGNNNANPCQIDGIRVATTWPEILGEEAEQPTVSPVSAFAPTNFYYGGTPLTLSDVANFDTSSNGWYQWLFNGEAIPGAAGIYSNTYSLPNPNEADSGNYSVVFSNNWDGSGLLVTSPPIALLITNQSAPIFTQQPQAGGRYLVPGAAPYTFDVSVIGSPPYTYRWYQITTNGVTNLLAGQTTNTLTLPSPIQASMVGSYFVEVANFLGTSTSAPAVFNVIVPTPGSYAAQVVSNQPWAYWQLDENYGTTNLHDYYGGHDGVILDTTNALVSGGTTNIYGVFQDVPAASYAGFPPNHVGLFIPNNGQFARVNMPGLVLYTNVMTWMGWIYLPSMPNAAPFIWNRDEDSTSGYGNAFGLEFLQAVIGGVTNYNLLGYQWGGAAEDPTGTNAYLGWTYTNSDLYVPISNWTFVAWVVNEPGSATLYMGTNNGPLTVASSTIPSAFDPNYPGTVYTNAYPLLLGRGGYPWAESAGNAWNGANVDMSDVAIFTNALSSNAIYQIYFAAMNQVITTTNSAGNLVLSWLQGTLLSSPDVQGPYTPVAGNPTSPYTVPKTAPRQFYRVQR